MHASAKLYCKMGNIFYKTCVCLRTSRKSKGCTGCLTAMVSDSLPEGTAGRFAAGSRPCKQLDLSWALLRAVGARFGRMDSWA